VPGQSFNNNKNTESDTIFKTNNKKSAALQFQDKY